MPAHRPDAAPERPDPASACPCGSALRYGACCGRWHAGPEALQAPTPEALMRSRYSAYVLGLWDYLQDTWHPAHRPAEGPGPVPGLRWLGLQVLWAEGDRVAFVARSKQGGRARRLSEVSRFVRGEDGRWRYADGQTPDGQPLD